MIELLKDEIEEKRKEILAKSKLLNGYKQPGFVSVITIIIEGDIREVFDNEYEFEYSFTADSCRWLIVKSDFALSILKECKELAELFNLLLSLRNIIVIIRQKLAMLNRLTNQKKETNR